MLFIQKFPEILQDFCSWSCNHISDFFTQAKIGLIPLKKGFLSRGKRQLGIFTSQNKAAWELCVM